MLVVNSAHVLDIGLLLPKMLPDILVTVSENVLIDRTMLPSFVVFDSGGFIIALENRYHEADEYLKKLIAIYRMVSAPNDLLLQLDLPLLPTMDKRFRLELQKKNVKYYKILSKIFGDKLVAVVHGWEEDEWSFQIRYIGDAKIIGVGSFFGMVSPPIKKIATPRLDPKLVAERLVSITRYLIDNTNARLMLLGAGSPKALYIASTLGYEMADSSSWRVAAFFGEVYHPRTLDRIKAVEVEKYMDDFRDAFDAIESFYGVPWDFNTWTQIVGERSRLGYIARAWFNAMVTKLVQHRLEDMSEKKIVEEMLRLYEKSSRWYTIAKIVARNAHHLGFRKAIARDEFRSRPW